MKMMKGHWWWIIDYELISRVLSSTCTAPYHFALNVNADTQVLFLRRRRLKNITLPDLESASLWTVRFNLLREINTSTRIPVPYSRVSAPTRLINGFLCPTRIRHRHSYDTCKTHYVQSERYFFIFDMVLMTKIRNKSYSITTFRILNIR